ncbi:hypothetical protein [Caballeronia sp. LZ016]|uniref:hypothetical protein n=1 Tax=Caballeronia sp. LZ016 TaxID=3038554 RepID=UPI0028541C4A|nr:hypothetical protein [Caballeronia sp. LZ016]MDR5738077.1 hypothetical protein [Caballeronia sp. LZ016]
MSADLDLRFLFSTKTESLLTKAEQFEELRQLCLSFPQADLPIDRWYPAASTEKESLLSPAFQQDRVSSRAIDLVDEDYDDIRTVGVWNGREGRGSAVFTLTHHTKGVCHASFESDEIPGLKFYGRVADVIENALAIWPVKAATAGPFAYAGLVDEGSRKKSPARFAPCGAFALQSQERLVSVTWHEPVASPTCSLKSRGASAVVHVNRHD